MKQAIKNLTNAELAKLVSQIKMPKYRLNQLYTAIYSGKIFDFDGITTLSKKEREYLKENYNFNSLELLVKSTSKTDNSAKLLFKAGESNIETVYMPHNDSNTEDKLNKNRATLCISTMTGCPMGCTFCATGSITKSRNLSSAEILDQIFLTQKEIGEEITNIVFMGMGEPFLNFDNLTKTLDIMTDEDLGLFLPKRITVSTVGIKGFIPKLAERKRPVKLAISLHATTEGTRSEIVPANKKYGIKEILADCELYYKKTRLPITFEYILFDNFNDTEDDIKRLIRFARRVPTKINIIPMNDVSQTIPNFKLTPANSEKIAVFVDLLKSNGIPAIVRRSMGADIQAACGQLALSEDKEV